MIKINEIFSESDNRIALLCDSVMDTADLAGVADYVINTGMDTVSVLPEMVSFLWACLEHSNVKIFTQYKVIMLPKTVEKEMSLLSQNIIQSYKNGASGIQLFIKKRNLEKFVDILSVIHDDLFFEHSLAIFLDIQDINIDDWEMVFDKLNTIKANVFGLTCSMVKNKHSDFIGRIYGMLENWNFDGELHFMLENDLYKTDQVMRLIESLRPELSNKVKFFLEQ